MKRAATCIAFSNPVKIKYKKHLLFDFSLHMLEFRFSLTRIFPYKDRIIDTVLIRGKNGSVETHNLAFFTQCFLEICIIYFQSIFFSKGYVWWFWKCEDDIKYKMWSESGSTYLVKVTKLTLSWRRPQSYRNKSINEMVSRW